MIARTGIKIMTVSGRVKEGLKISGREPAKGFQILFFRFINNFLR
jgi:hypothetical protein